MNNFKIQEAFQRLSTPLIADACLRTSVPLRIAESGIRANLPMAKVAGQVLPVQHFGSVDIFIEVLASAQHGDILVIDNQRRTDEACIGDLIVLEAQIRHISGIVVWGYHRDSAELSEIGMPVFSYGTYPAGPVRLDARSSTAMQTAFFGQHEVTRDDVVFADDDGVIFVPFGRVQIVLETAHTIYERERRQADQLRANIPLYEQLQFANYLEMGKRNPAYTFRKHLRVLHGEIEE